jgi:hypothetical protein
MAKKLKIEHISINNMTSLFPPRESLVSDIPPGDRKTEKLFFTVCTVFVGALAD